MRVKVTHAKPFNWYAVGEEYEVHNQEDGVYRVDEKRTILKSNCTIIPDETENRVPFNYEVWKEKGGKVYHKDNEVTQLHKFDTPDPFCYGGIMNESIVTFRETDLAMSAPDSICYANTNGEMIGGGYTTIEIAKICRSFDSLHILEINITKGTNKIVHTYNEKV